MAAWHRSRRADFGLRGLGLLISGIAYTAISHLCALHIAPDTADALAYGLAAIGFLGMSAGSALAMLGHHLFDEIAVSERWRRRSRVTFLSSENANAMDTTEPALLVVGRDADGSWTVSERSGRILGRFASAQAAQRFANEERSSRTAIAIATSAGFPPRIAGRLSLRTAAIGSSEAAGA